METVILVRSLGRESRIDVARHPESWPDAIACLQRSGLFDVIEMRQGNDVIYRVEGLKIREWAPGPRTSGMVSFGTKSIRNLQWRRL